MGKYIDLIKVMKTIDSVESIDQLAVAEKMADQWFRKYNEIQYTHHSGYVGCGPRYKSEIKQQIDNKILDKLREFPTGLEYFKRKRPN